VPNLLVIGGSDSSGGAGVSADIQTIHHLGGSSTLCVTAVTAQGPRGFFQSHAIPGSILQAQLESIRELSIDGIKIGMLPNTESIDIVAAFLNSVSIPFVIIDPVLKSSSGGTLCSEDCISSFKENLFPLATLITPNLDEANFLTQESCSQYEGVPILAEKCLIFGSDAVLIKGGHLESNDCKDFLMFKDGTVKSFVHDRILNGTDVRGTGCRLASAIAHYFVCNKNLTISIENAVDYINEYIARKAVPRII
jgi:hydroxymethylpyrimidine/phosphomethylpyrimidine kinase